MNWGLGYNVDVGYTFGYYREEDPLWLDLCALVHGVRPPSLTSEKGLRYLELGCGQGLNLCLLAACRPEIEFVGIDFNPLHIAHAKHLSSAAGLTNVRFIEANFVDLAANWPEELGRFHYVSAHGVLSWISRSVRESLYGCLDNALFPGGLVYFSYNALPGWLSGLPIQHLMRLWQVREALTSLTAIDVGIKRLQSLIEANIPMVQLLPGMKPRVEKIPNLDKNYLVNEYLHEEWTPFWFDEMERELSSHKLRFVGTATASDWYLVAMLPENAKRILATYSDPTERQVMLDVLVNQSFRRDIWARGQAPIWPEEQRDALLSRRFALIARPSAGEGENPYKFSTSAGEVMGRLEIYAPLYEALADGQKTLKDLLQVPVSGSTSNRTLPDTIQALGLMLHAGHVALLPPKSFDPRAAKALNRVLIESASRGAPYRYLIASALPWVVSAGDVDQILASFHITHPKADRKSLGTYLTERLISLGRGLLVDGKPITSREDILPRAEELAEAFLEKTLPNWRKLGIV